MASNGPVEPDATSRAFAKVCHQTFIALTLEGFTERQALVIVGQMIGAAAASQAAGDQ